MTGNTRRMTYSLYQNQFDNLAEVLALYELGLFKEGWELLTSHLEGDRGEHFDADDLAGKVKLIKDKYQKIRPDLEDLFPE